MTRLLLDSHVVLWLLEDRQLHPEALAAITERATSLFVSIATPWELAIKQSLGQLRVRDDYLDLLTEQGVELLGIDVAHTEAVRALPLHHRDPFDRMLVAQAQVERLTLVTRDARLTQYDVAVLEA